MDMNWQAMLHEAANASFEKDIEVRFSYIYRNKFLTIMYCKSMTNKFRKDC